ncbi:MAG TPA: diguanylate cyclase [Candidatus Nanopelagicales bacterium]
MLLLAGAGRIALVNPAARAVLGPRARSGTPLADLAPAAARSTIDAFVDATTTMRPGDGRSAGPVVLEARKGPRGFLLEAAPSRGEDGEPMLIVTLHAAELPAGAASAARIDSLTGLDARATGLAALAAACSPEATGCLLVVDLDGFGALNASFGISAGDAVLVQVAARLARAVAPGMHLARIDGDAFLIVAPAVHLAHGEHLGRTLLGLLAAPMDVVGTPMAITASIGVASLASRHPDAAMGAALAGMRLAKERGGRQVAQASGGWKSRPDIIDAVHEAEAEAAIARQEARTDVLTHLANRRQFEEDVALLEEQVVAGRMRMAAVYFDLDHFGALNRERGYGTGDDALRRVARIVAAACRAEDRVYRVGGEEFAALLTDTDEAGAALVAERLRRSVEAAGIPHGAWPDWPVATITLGAAATTGPGSRLDDVVTLASERMQLAKRLGRNRVLPEQPGDRPARRATDDAPADTA